MKKIILITILSIGVTFIGIPQENQAAKNPWRTLTFTNVGGFTFGGSYMNTFSATLFYELNHGISIQSWSGINWNLTYDSGWISTQNTINKSFGKDWMVGSGFLYGGGMAPGNIANDFSNNDMTLIFTISKRYKLR